GHAALMAINQLENAEKVKNRLVFGQNIGQAYTLIATGNAELGLVALSQLVHQKFSAKDHYQVIPDSYYEPIVQSAILVSDKEAAADFFRFIQSEEAINIITQSGYGVPE